MNSGGKIFGWLTPHGLRIAELALLMVLITAILLRGLYREQVEAGDEHREAVSRQSIRRIRVPARRGRIFTSDMVVAADNRPVRNLVFYPEEMRLGLRVRSIDHMLDVSERIANALGRRNTLTRKSIERHLNTSPGLPLVVFQDLDDREMALALECSRQLRGIDVEVGEIRNYPLGSFAPHIIGYTHLESPREAADRREFFYYIPDSVGRSGIELLCDAPAWAKPNVGLRGTPGYALNQVDHLGYIHRRMVDHQDPVHGSNVVLTLDSRAQRIAEKLLDGRRGAIVAVDAANGDVLAAATAPRFDLRDFSPKLSPTVYRVLHDDPALPLFNRAFQGSYTPGSIMKPVVAMALLDAGVDRKEEVECLGFTEIGRRSIRCAAHRRGGHGPTDLENAIAWSCNCYFNQMGMRVGEEELFRAFRSAGIGQTAGIGLAESRGIMPSHELKRRRNRSEWTRFDTALLSMGQGLITVTPLQAALYAAAFCNGGTLWKPHLVLRLSDPEGRTLWERSAEKRGELLLTGKKLEPILNGMFKVVNSSSGSGRDGAVQGLNIYGKTGSAEVGSRGRMRLTVWFIAFTEYRGRKYAMSVMVEDGTSGGGDCAPLAAAFFRDYLRPKPEEKTVPEPVPAI